MDLLSISEEIPQEVIDFCETYAIGRKQFCSWLEYHEGEIVERVFGYKRPSKSRKLLITEVIRRETGSPAYYFRNLYLVQMGGWYPVFDSKNVIGHSYGYQVINFDGKNFGKWKSYDDAGVNVTTVYINPQILFETDEFKHCGYRGGDLLEYIRMFRRNHAVEFFGKHGIYPKKSLVRLAEKDINFAKWLTKQDVFEINTLGTEATVYAYKKGISISQARLRCYNARQLGKGIPALKECPCIDREKLNTYLVKNKIEYGDYNDYLRAVKYLMLDLKDTKNVYPKDFWRMHDLRIDEYASKRAEIEEKEKKKLYARFEKKAGKCKQYELHDGDYCVIIPQSVQELIREGSNLHHCVGRMGYDVKVADGRSVIAFLRLEKEPDKSLVTIEYSLKNLKLIQAHGDYNRALTPEEKTFVEKWCEYVEIILKGEKQKCKSATE